MEDESTVSASYVFRGIEYIVTMIVQPGTSLTVEVEDRLTADQWRGSFDAAYVEDLTHKTGNFKQFNIFISMLESAVIQATDSVSLDLLTYADLESLRQRKAGSAVKSTIPAQRSVSINSKRYLILTYTVEFDRIHYPLPLPYMGKPDPRALQETIRQLRAELKALRQQGTNETRLKELERLRKEHDFMKKEKESLETEFLQFRREMKNTSTGNAVKELKMLKTMVRSLEEELMKEKTKHQRSATKHGQQYRDLLEELEEVRASERNLKIRVKNLTNELALYRRDKVSTNRLSRPLSRERKGSFDRFLPRERSLSRERERSLSRDRSRDRSWNGSDRLSSRDRSRERPSSAPNRSGLSERSSGLRNSLNSYRSRTPSPAGARKPRFDPTAYCKDRDRKKRESMLSKQRHVRGNMSGLSASGRPSPGSKQNSRLSGRRNRSRASPFGSQEDLSDACMSDSSYTGLRNYNREVKSRKTNRTPINSYLSSPEIPKKPERTRSKTRNDKILASTPDSQRGRKRSVRNKENIPNSADEDSDYFDRSAEISEIDARLSRLQELMKTSLS